MCASHAAVRQWTCLCDPRVIPFREQGQYTKSWELHPLPALQPETRRWVWGNPSISKSLLRLLRHLWDWPNQLGPSDHLSADSLVWMCCLLFANCHQHLKQWGNPSENTVSFFAQGASLVCLQPSWSRQHAPIWNKPISSLHVSHVGPHGQQPR